LVSEQSLGETELWVQIGFELYHRLVESGIKDIMEMVKRICSLWGVDIDIVGSGFSSGTWRGVEMWRGVTRP
jgi:hypothetical protein